MSADPNSGDRDSESEPPKSVGGWLSPSGLPFPDCPSVLHTSTDLAAIFPDLLMSVSLAGPLALPKTSPHDVRSGLEAARWSRAQHPLADRLHMVGLA